MVVTGTDRAAAATGVVMPLRWAGSATGVGVGVEMLAGWAGVSRSSGN
jgi:hypothetical protein